VSRTDGRNWRSAEVVGTVIGIVAVLVALVALLLDHPPFGSRGEAAPQPGPGPTTPTSGPAPEPPTTSGPTTSGGPPRRYLTDLTPDSGGGYVQRVGSHSLRMACGSGDSDDRQREVSYVLPPAVTYRSFSSGVGAAGSRDTRIQTVLLVDQRQVAAPVLPTGSSTRLTWSGQSAGQLTLRIICDPGATTATFTDPALSG
jgi:hypothetical protein